MTPDEPVPDHVDDVPVFAVVGSGHTVDGDGTALPTVVIDASAVPSVADLARVHAVEGIGDIQTSALRAGGLVVLGVSMTTPVTATFAIAFDAERDRAILDDALGVGCLVIAHTDPGDVGEQSPQWLAIDIDGPALARCLGAA